MLNSSRSHSALLLVVVVSVLVVSFSSYSSANSSPKQLDGEDDNDLGWLNEYNINLSSRQSAPTQTQLGSVQSSQPVAPYKQPSSWIVSILREFFDDIDWKTIEDAREQIEKFIRKVDRLIGSVRSVISKATPNQQQRQQDQRHPTSDRAAATSGRWWLGGASKDNTNPDLTSVKGMLDRVACFVGYVRLMNLSNEALAELDASKVVSQLFNAGSRRNSSAWSWFG